MPQLVEALADKKVLSAQCGWLHTAFLVAPSWDDPSTYSSLHASEKDTSTVMGNNYSPS